jgi:hypothetical protein
VVPVARAVHRRQSENRHRELRLRTQVGLDARLVVGEPLTRQLLAQRRVLGERKRIRGTGLGLPETPEGPVHVGAARDDRALHDAGEGESAARVLTAKRDHVQDDVRLERAQPREVPLEVRDVAVDVPHLGRKARLGLTPMEDDDVVAALGQRPNGVRAGEARPADDEHAHQSTLGVTRRRARSGAGRDGLAQGRIVRLSMSLG